TFRELRGRRHFTLVAGSIAVALAAIFPLLLAPLGTTLDTSIYAVAYVVFALGLNIVVGFAGLLDLGYVAFYAIGAYTIGWFGSDWFASVTGNGGAHVGVGGQAATLPGIHLNFVMVVIIAMVLTAIAGAIIGLTTLRLRRSAIAIVTLAFGE